jgi:NADH dehydrogenase/NADH:ubiquinone oxidoreductase subunit G
MKEMVKRCPRKVYRYDSNVKMIDIEDVNRCNLCNECVKYAQELKLDSKAIRIDEDDTKFIYTVESTGALPPEEVVKKAFRILT